MAPPHSGLYYLHAGWLVNAYSSHSIHMVDFFFPWEGGGMIRKAKEVGSQSTKGGWF